MTERFVRNTRKGSRRSPAARWIGLALPRFMLRLPYGKRTSAIESFPFEEMPESEHSAYLWGNPAFFCAYLLGESFLLHGWKLSPIERRIDHLPLHVYEKDGESEAKQCAEILMTEGEAESGVGAGDFVASAGVTVEASSLSLPPRELERYHLRESGCSGRETSPTLRLIRNL